MSLLVKVIAIFVGAMFLFRLANSWMRSRLDPNRAVQRVQSRQAEPPPPPRPTPQARAATAPEDEPTASMTFNLPDATGGAPTVLPPAPAAEPDAPSSSMTFNLPPARTPPPAPPEESQASTDAASWTPAAPSVSAPATTDRVPSLDSMELVPSARPVGPFARKAPDPVDPILTQLRDRDPAVRRAGLNALREQRDSMSREQARRLLEAAGGDLPEVDDDEIPVAEAILLAAQSWVADEDVEVLRAVYPRLPNGARGQALVLLASIGSRDAAQAWAECLRRHGGGSQLGTRQSQPWSLALEHGDVFFPALLEADLHAAALEEVLLLALRFLEGEAFPNEGRESLEHAVVELWEESHEELVDALEGPAWSWTERARSLRRRAGILLDLMGYLRDDETAASLTEGVTLQDPRLRLFALLSSLRRGRDVTAEDVAPVAASAETRRALYDFLKPAKKLSLMPRASRTQKAMAEADLARVLAFPGELGHAPDAIEAMATVTIDDPEQGKVDWHVIRFQSGAPAWADKGWMQGISGPWVRTDGPAGQARGDTSSSYAPWTEQSDAELAQAVQDFTAAWTSAALEP